MRITLKNHSTGVTTWVQAGSVAGSYSDMLSGRPAYSVAATALRRARERLGGPWQTAVDSSGRDVVVCPLARGR